MRRIVAAAALLAFFMTAAPTNAHGVVVPSRIKRTSLATSGDDVDKVGGVVHSRRAKCEYGRKVVVTWVNEDLELELYGVGFTDINGNWAIEDSGPTDKRYNFRVARKSFGPRGHRHTCASDSFNEVLH